MELIEGITNSEFMEDYIKMKTELVYTFYREVNYKLARFGVGGGEELIYCETEKLIS